MLSSWGCKASELKDLEGLMEALQTRDDQSVAELSQDLTLGKIERRPSISKKQVADEKIVQTYVAELRNSELDRLSAIAIMSRMKADKKLRVAELNAISNSLFGTSETISAKPEAIRSIEAWLQRRFDTVRRLGDTSGAL